jgi:hypothetical protein
MNKLTVVCFLLIITLTNLIAQDKKIDDLTFLSVDEKYEDLVYKAEKLMQHDKYKKHPAVWIYAAKGYYEMSKRPGKFSVGEKDSKYPKPLKNSQKHLYKYVKTMKKVKKYFPDYEGTIEDNKEFIIAIADTSNKLAQMLFLNEKYRKSASSYKAAFRAVPSDPVLQLWQGIGEVKSKNSVEGKKSLAAAMKVIDENFVPTSATSPVLAHGMLLAEEILRGIPDYENADKAKKLIDVFKKYDPDELDKKKLAERKEKAKKAANDDMVMRKFLSDEDDEDNKGKQKGKLIIKDGDGSNGNGKKSDDEELDKLEEEAKGDKK